MPDLVLNQGQHKPIREPGEALNDHYSNGCVHLVFVELTDIRAVYSRETLIELVAGGEYPDILKIIWLSGPQHYDRHSDQTETIFEAALALCREKGWPVPTFITDALPVETEQAITAEVQRETDSEARYQRSTASMGGRV